MKTFLIALMGFCIGAVVAIWIYVPRAFNDGWRAGYAAPHPQTQESKVVGNMLCSYAAVACTNRRP